MNAAESSNNVIPNGQGTHQATNQEINPIEARRHRMVLLLIAIAVAVVMFFIGQKLFLEGAGDNKQATSQHNTAIPVTSASVQVDGLTQYLALTGSIEAEVTVSVVSEVSGQLTASPWNLGDQIPGQSLIATVDDRSFRLAADRASAEVSVAQSRLTEAKQLVTVRQRQAQRMNQLVQQQAASIDDLDQAELDRLAAEAAVQVAAAELLLAQRRLAEVQLDVERSRILAPWPADEIRTVTTSPPDSGNFIEAGDMILHAIATNPLIAVCRISEQHLSQMSIGRELYFVTDALPGKQLRGTIKRIAPELSATSRQQRIELEIANPDGQLRPGMFLDGRLAIATRDQAFIIPETALLGRHGNPHIFIIESRDDTSVARLLPVHIVMRTDGVIAIEARHPSDGQSRNKNSSHSDTASQPSPAASLLVDGVQVVTLGQHLLTDGDTVAVQHLEQAIGTNRPGEQP